MTYRYLLSRFVLVCLLASLLPACSGGKGEKAAGAEPKRPASAAHVDADLRTRLGEFAARPRVAGQFAFYVYDNTAGAPVFGHDERHALPSASCMKLLSGVAGLHLLGTSYRYVTSMYVRGQVDGDGVLHGDATLKAGLDPQLDAAVLSQLARELRKKGVRRIGGRVVADLVTGEPVKSEEHWYPWDLSFSRYGLLYKGAPRILAAFKAALRSAGIAFDASAAEEGRMPEGSRRVASVTRSVDDVIRRMWKNSSNTQATALLYSIGHRVNPCLPPEQAGVAYLRRFLRNEIGMRDTSLVIHDGCGLCTHNHLSPEALVAVLRYGYAHPRIYAMLRRNLSVAGVDGTLTRLMSGPKLRGKVYAKTGTLSHPYGISTLAGYCESPNGHVLAFAIADSEMSVLDARVLQRKLCEELVK